MLVSEIGRGRRGQVVSFVLAAGKMGGGVQDAVVWWTNATASNREIEKLRSMFGFAGKKKEKRRRGSKADESENRIVHWRKRIFPCIYSSHLAVANGRSGVA